MRYCPNCPRTYPDEFNFCLNDGMRLQTKSEMQEAETLIGISENTLITPMTREDARSLFAKSSAEQAASRVNDELALQRKRSNWRNSVEGMQAADKEVEQLFRDLQDLIERINIANPEIQMTLTVENQRHGNLLTNDGRVGLSMHWGHQFGNTLEDSCLSVMLFQPGTLGSPLKEVSTKSYEADIDEYLRVGWRAHVGKGDFYTSFTLTDKYLKEVIKYLDYLSKRSDR